MPNKCLAIDKQLVVKCYDHSCEIKEVSRNDTVFYSEYMDLPGKIHKLMKNFKNKTVQN